MKRPLLTFVLLAGAAPAFAQHPCDTLSPATVSRKSPVTTGVCWNEKDEDGVAATATSIKVFIDGTLAKTVSSPAPTGAANAAGLFYFQVTGLAVSKGTRSLTFTVVTVDGESDPSTAFTFSVVGGKPSKPVAARVE
jgi:archaellum component FlaG (FlaF/FlaG flagellin family)